MCKKKGTTLIEIIVYLGLLSVVTLIVGININYLNTRKIQMRARSEFNDINNTLKIETLDVIKKNSGSKVSVKEDYIKIGEEKIELNYLDLKFSKSHSYNILKNGKFATDFEISFTDETGEEYMIIECKKCGKFHT